MIERDGGRGATALFRNVYVVDLRSVGADGFLAKRHVVDLAAIPDPDLRVVAARSTPATSASATRSG